MSMALIIYKVGVRSLIASLNIPIRCRMSGI